MVGGLPANRTVYGFAVSPADPGIMYVAVRDGLFKSMDAGKTWNPVGQHVKKPVAVAVNPKRSGEVYVATVDGATFKSADGGTTWVSQRE